MTVLITGFEPFADYSINPSYEAVRRLPDHDARIPDNEGQQPKEQEILKDGEKELRSSLPISHMLDQLQEAGIPAQQSDSAGTFVCNEVFYRLMKMAEASTTIAGFIHIPYITGMGKGKPEMKLEDVIRGLEICVGVAVRSLILE